MQAASRHDLESVLSIVESAGESFDGATVAAALMQASCRCRAGVVLAHLTWEYAMPTQTQSQQSGALDCQTTASAPCWFDVCRLRSAPVGWSLETFNASCMAQRPSRCWQVCVAVLCTACREQAARKHTQCAARSIPYTCHACPSAHVYVCRACCPPSDDQGCAGCAAREICTRTNP